ncbi:fanconi-associated nuclease 1 homolog isoform X2 [Phoenix dactylifera]|uniref:Fanconi-associated nuclease n=1 Tax=Phoenix dactylifera TaxID=42345 RepID=A0A8B9AW25_PHODC|nr:fanconi-associated nuclease 1 homolog isoform X2 [Phoenix dactylifera]
MLHGRDSLVRLIGKRRRTFSSPLAQHLRPQSAAKRRPSPSSVEDEAPPPKQESQIHGAERVSCPVCGSSIRGTDYSVNSHLDTCLARGVKRKLTQSTLLQFKFCPRSRSESSLVDLDNDKEKARKRGSTNESDPSNFPLSSRYGSTRMSERMQCASASPYHSLSSSETCTDASLEGLVIEDAVISKVKDPLYSHMFRQSVKTQIPKLDTCGPGDAKYVEILETFIVGCRFHDNAELRQGASIFLLRDPQNSKDRHAIKVLSADFDGRVLGYLPRELAKYLSPLIDNHHIKCEGSVTSLPRHPYDVIPIQLVCQMAENSDMKSDDCQILKSLWESVLLAVEYGRANHPSMTKYQRNFCLMIEDVMNHYAYLFTDKEKSFLGVFNSLSDDGQRLFIRLYTRKGPWFRMSNVSYPEISDPLQAAEELQLAGYLFLFNSCEDPFTYDMKEVLNLLNVYEIREILKQKAINCTRRPELINVLYSAYENEICPLLPKVVFERVGTCVRISSAADIFLWRVQRLFFLSGEQDLSSFLLVDLGLVKFPDYACNISHQVFAGRDDLLEYEEAIEVAQVMDEYLDANNMDMVIRCIDVSDSHIQASLMEDTRSSILDSPPTFFSCFSASWVYSKVLTLGISVFEHKHRYEDAIRLLKGLLNRITCDSRRGYWTLRLSVDLEHIGRLNESLSVAEEGILDSWVRAGSKVALQRRVLRLGKPPRRWKMPSYADYVKQKIKEVYIRGRPLVCETGTKNLFYGYDGELCGVEQLALQYYAGEGGWLGVHSESGIWMTFFGILMWDVIFSNIPDVFRSRFQTAPLDLDTDDFYVARKSLIESHLQKIHDGMADEILITSWGLHFGTACRGVKWERHSLSDLRAAVSCIGGRRLAALFRHLSLDYRSWSSGMPDLLLWRFHGDMGRGQAKLVEVKGPRDRLSEQQRAWMLILLDCGFDAEICKVSPNPSSP